MPIKSTIGGKIFGLAILLICLTLALAFFLLVHVLKLEKSLGLIAENEVPLAAAFSDLNESGLRRRMAFERWFGALSNPNPNKAVLTEAQENYKIFSEKITEDLLKVKTILTDGRNENLNEIRAVVHQIEQEYPIITERQKQILDLQQAGKWERANDILNLLNDLQRIVQTQREQLQAQLNALAIEVSRSAAKQQNSIVWLTIAATASTTLLGLVLARIITRRLVGPVHSLVAGIRTVEKGDLNVQLPICSTDEVGLLTNSFNYFVREMRSKEQMKQTFGRYIDPRILERVILKPEVAETEGGRQNMSVSFTDIAGFTDLSEQMTPSALVKLLNRHFELQAEAIQQHLGVVDKFIGDAVMAFWGAPFTPEKEHALLACRSAIAQIKALEKFRSELSELTGLRKNIPEFHLRIGISTGPVVVGNLGSEHARSYTVIGDTVNLGSRLEAANKFYGTKILITEATKEAAGSAILTREIDFLTVKGKSETTRVFELLAINEDVSPKLQDLSKSFNEALGAYRIQKWDDAEKRFRSCLDSHPNDKPSLTFLNRIEKLRAQTLSSDWNGVWHLESK